MLHNRQLGDRRNLGSEQDTSSEDELTMVSAERKELEAMVIRTVHRVIEPIMENLVRKVVKEEIELAQEKLLISMRRNSENEAFTSKERSLQLQFLDKISLPVLTGMKIKGEKCSSIRIALVDALTEEHVDSGPEASAKLEIVVLEGVFEGDEGKNWTSEEFERKIVREKEGKKSLLVGDVSLSLKGGMGSIGEISFTHNASWMKNCEFRLGARVVDNFVGIRMKEAVTESFTVKDRRGELYKKHYPPSLSDELWRLEKIRRDGAFHKRLAKETIETVKDFLVLLDTDHQKLQNILGAGTKTWETIINHARTWVFDKRVCFYSSPSFEQKIGVVFNEAGQLLGVLLKSRYVFVENLSEARKADAFELIASASEHWEDVQQIDDVTSFTRASPYIFNASAPSNPPGIENPCGHNSENSQWVVENNHIQPSTSSQDIISSINPSGDTSYFDDFDMEFPDEILKILDQSPSFPILNQESNQNFDENEYLWHSYDAQSRNSEVESHAVQESGGSGYFMVGPEAASVNKAQRRWTIVASVPRWFAIRKRIAAVRGIQVQKKQRTEKKE